MLGVELTKIAIFDKTKKEIKKMEESTKSLYLNFDKIKVLNKKLLLLNLLMFMQDTITHFKNTGKQKRHMLYLDISSKK